MHNTFTYRHSELPSVRPEIKAEIVALGLHADDLILKSQGNYRELEELAETLDNCLDSCELNLQSIRIIPDNSPQPAANTMTNLPMDEQTVIFGTALANQILLSIVQKITGLDPVDVFLEITEQTSVRMKDIGDEQITTTLKDFIEKYRDDPTQLAFKVKIPTDT